jgi:hypothetical protein
MISYLFFSASFEIKWKRFTWRWSEPNSEIGPDLVGWNYCAQQCTLILKARNFETEPLDKNNLVGM